MLENDLWARKLCLLPLSSSYPKNFSSFLSFSYSLIPPSVQASSLSTSLPAFVFIHPVFNRAGHFRDFLHIYTTMISSAHAELGLKGRLNWWPSLKPMARLNTTSTLTFTWSVYSFFRSGTLRKAWIAMITGTRMIRTITGRTPDLTFTAVAMAVACFTTATVIECITTTTTTTLI